MRNPDAPFLEFGFHFNKVSGRDAFRRLARTVIEDYQAVPKEALFLPSGANVLLQSDQTSLGTSRRIESTTDLWHLLDDPHRLMIKLAVEKGTKIVPDAKEYIALLPINSRDPRMDGNSVAIWIEGAAFSLPSSEGQLPSKTKKLGLKSRTIFKDLVRRLKPTYASITIDYGLESPCDLRDDPRTYAFRDFYLETKQFGNNTLQEIQTRFPNADYDDVEGGKVVTTSRAFVRSPYNLDFSSADAHRLSEFVARIVAKT